ncbi:hypothetical protein [Rufibacter tibetensis]|uniref:Uncharacterized protein n=1 Tax=Rufibacter tibetensis TaxID=512763 RepID=A0A0P0CFM3_9BACT|nr:hypothetical protein [Rufibacter tibetensis]ALJ00701.1 hypothetical protein DC20_19110 [Rufibacter tibetensis]
MKIWYLWILILLVSCSEPEILKEVNWNENCISWEVLDGGATTSFKWLIKYSEGGENRKDLIFESYSSPYISDIEVYKDELLILCPNIRNKVNDTITINLKDINKYIDEPIVYEQDILKRKNEYYKEPSFVKKDREYAVANGLL